MKKYKYIILILAIFIISPLVLSIDSSLFQYRESTKIKTSSWTPDGTIICNASFEVFCPQIISDGVGGAIIVWTENRSGVDYDIYAQRIDSDGITQWPDNGVVICSANNSQGEPKITTDGAGGAIIVWGDGRSGVISDLYAQRINSNGITQWTPNGTAICTKMGIGGTYQVIGICSDGAEGAIITWSDLRNECDIYAQRINSNGIPQWTPNGTALCTVSGNQDSPRICSDGAGGAIISWHDWRIGAGGAATSYAQKVNSNGIPQWTPNGTAISPAASATSHFCSSEIIPDGAGGAIITYAESRLVGTTWYSFIYTQRINSSGIIQWLPNGTALRTFHFESTHTALCSDGAGGAIVTWDDERGGSRKHDIYAQKIGSNGNTQWTPNGTAICTSKSSQIASKICSDGAGGAILTWNDQRGYENDIYAQKIDSNGTMQWTQDGVAICNADGHQSDQKICSDGDGGAFITWVDYRDESSGDIYAYRIDSTGGITAGDGNNGVISFGNYFFAFTIISIISLIVIIKYRKFEE